MGFHKKTKDFKNIVSKLRHTARHLDMTKDYSNQTPIQIQKYMSSVSRNIPLIDAFEGRWPAIIYGKYWVVNERKHRRAQQKKRKCAMNAREDENENNLSASSTHKQPAQAAPRPHAQTLRVEDNDLASSATAPTTVSSRRSAAARSQTVVTKKKKTSQSKTSCAESSTSQLPPLATASSGDYTVPVLQFLRSLEPPCDHLLPFFTDIGIHNADLLLALAKMPDKGEFLRKEWMSDLGPHKLTKIYLKLVVDGLDKLARNWLNGGV